MPPRQRTDLVDLRTKIPEALYDWLLDMREQTGESYRIIVTRALEREREEQGK